MEVDIGDPIYVQKEAEDCWCEGKFTVICSRSLSGNIDVNVLTLIQYHNLIAVAYYLYLRVFTLYRS